MRTVFMCDFCDAFDENLANTKEHELECVYDPAKRTCATCGWYKIDFDGENICLLEHEKFEDYNFVSNCEKWWGE